MAKKSTIKKKRTVRRPQAAPVVPVVDAVESARWFRRRDARAR